jgi:hypothetical protein
MWLDRDLLGTRDILRPERTRHEEGAHDKKSMDDGGQRGMGACGGSRLQRLEERRRRPSVPGEHRGVGGGECRVQHVHHGQMWIPDLRRRECMRRIRLLLRRLRVQRHRLLERVPVQDRLGLSARIRSARELSRAELLGGMPWGRPRGRRYGGLNVRRRRARGARPATLPECARSSRFSSR